LLVFVPVVLVVTISFYYEKRFLLDIVIVNSPTLHWAVAHCILQAAKHRFSGHPVSGLNQSINQLFYSAPKSWPNGQLSLLHLGITKTEKIELKYKTDEQISPVNSLEPW